MAIRIVAVFRIRTQLGFSDVGSFGFFLDLDQVFLGLGSFWFFRIWTQFSFSDVGFFLGFFWIWIRFFQDVGFFI